MPRDGDICAALVKAVVKAVVRASSALRGVRCGVRANPTQIFVLDSTTFTTAFTTAALTTVRRSRDPEIEIFMLARLEVECPVAAAHL